MPTILNLRPFQIALLALFLVVGFVSIAFLSTFEGLRNATANPYGREVVIWGTLDEQAMQRLIQSVGDDDRDFLVVRYQELDSRTFTDTLVEALATNRGPDVVLLSHEDFVTLRPTLLAIPYDAISRRQFQDTYLDGAELFARPDGIYALPFAVDPLIMYWNRDIFSSGGFALPPSTWEQLVTNVVPSLTLRNATRDILQATVAFGEYRNVENAKETLSLLLMQSGSRLIEEDDRGYIVALNDPVIDNAPRPLQSALQFYSDFSNANSPLYSWNRSLPADRTAFLGEQLALYFGFGSEYDSLRAANPNFNFDTTEVPQGAGATTKQTYGTFYGLALMRDSDNTAGAYAAITRLSGHLAAHQEAGNFGLAPVHRQSYTGAVSGEAVTDTIRSSALIARGWLDPNPSETDGIFQTMVEDVVSNRQKVAGAVADATRRLELSF
jgi:ABC-type glycerol-3-phosphate transport system substrate-binding protein